LNKESWRGEVQHYRAVVPEAATQHLEANLWNGNKKDLHENVWLTEEPKKINDGDGVS
jgi:hypothetical protein